MCLICFLICWLAIHPRFLLVLLVYSYLALNLIREISWDNWWSLLIISILLHHLYWILKHGSSRLLRTSLFATFFAGWNSLMVHGLISDFSIFFWILYLLFFKWLMSGIHWYFKGLSFCNCSSDLWRNSVRYSIENVFLFPFIRNKRFRFFMLTLAVSISELSMG